MTKDIKEDIYNEVIRIADELSKQSIECDDDSIFWKTISSGNSNTTEWVEQLSLYSGVSGIMLFFVELYKNIPDKKYLEIVRKSSNYLIKKLNEQPTNLYSFYTGDTGIIYALYKASEIIPEINPDPLLQEMIKKIHNSFNNISQYSDLLGSDVLNGKSGILLGWLHLHAITRNSEILSVINILIQKLVHSLSCTTVGIHNEHSYSQVRGLCGFSHGASGIGAVFLELGHYFKNPVFYHIARETFRYEDNYFNKTENNWPDFRKSLYSGNDIEKAEDALKKGDIDFFSKPNFMNAWCHGAAGISLARHRANQLIGNKRFFNQALIGIDNLNKHKYSSLDGNITYTLCHGITGNSDICFEMYLAGKQKKWLELAFSIAQNALTAKECIGFYKPGIYWANEEDNSLFMGTAGIGYFFLRCLYTDKVPSIMYPKVELVFDNIANLRPYQSITMKFEDLHKYFLYKSYPITAYLFQNENPHEFQKIISEIIPISKLKSKFVYNSKHYPVQSKACIFADAIRYETSIDKLGRMNSYSFLYVKKTVVQKMIDSCREMTDEQIEQSKIKVDENCQLLVCRNNWLQYKRNLSLANNQDNDKYYFLLNPTWNSVEEFNIGWLPYKILTLLKKNKRVAEICHEILGKTKLNELDKGHLKEQIIGQIRELLKRGIIVQEY